MIFTLRPENLKDRMNRKHLEEQVHVKQKTRLTIT